MTLKNTQNQFGTIAKTFHWSIALVLLALLSVGLYMGSMDASPLKFQVYGLHKSFGFLVLFLVAGRLIWRFANVRPAPLPSHNPVERALSKLIHFLLYCGLIGMPMSGWLMSSAGDFPAAFFGFEMPDLIVKDRSQFQFFRDMHELTAFMLIGALALHFAGAFKHHFIDKDETLQRMTTSGLGFTGGAVIAILAIVALGVPASLVAKDYMAAKEESGLSEASMKVEPQEAEKTTNEPASSSTNEWVIDQSLSTIYFEATQYNQPFQGQFDNFAGEIFFDPDDLENSSADITIYLNGIETGSDDRDDLARDAEWFDIKQFPIARFKTTSVENTGANQYLAHADLTIRGITQQVTMPFTLDFSIENIAVMHGDFTVNRLDFGVGQGQWETAEAIGAEVKMSVSVTAQKLSQKPPKPASE